MAVWFIEKPYFPDGKMVGTWDFMKCHAINPPYIGLSAKTSYGEVVTDVCFGAFDIIYARPKMADAMLACAGDEIQLVPVHVDGFNEDVFIVNVLNKVKCIDESRSLFEKWALGNAERPDRAGEYKMIRELFIDPNATEGRNILRPWGWTTQVIVSEKFKEAVESVGSAGTVFIPVS